MPLPTRRILLVDCDMFFVQVARLEDPDGAGQEPLLMVGGSPSGRGVITSAAYEVRAFGVHSGMPTARALELCPKGVVVPVPRGACVARSRAVRKVLERWTPVLEAASIDEFYLDLTGTERLFRAESLAATAQRLREDVLQETSISVSVGGGTQRMVAKVAVARAKPGGVHVVPPGEEAAFLQSLPLETLPGVGPALLELLVSRGLRTGNDVMAAGEEWLIRWCGQRRGRWLFQRLSGVDPTPISPGQDRKSVSSERTFPRDLDTAAELERQLLGLATSVGRGLRKRGLRGRTVTVKLRLHDFATYSAARSVADGLETDPALFALALELFRELRSRHSGGVRLLGVGVSSLDTTHEGEQLALFDASGPRGESPAQRRLARVQDQLRDRFGESAIRPGSMTPLPMKPDTPPASGTTPPTDEEP
ncbi:MAG: DNA polymerase IV [Gemmatimonadota bacterium]